MNPGAAPASAVPDPITRRTAWLAAGSAVVTLGAWAVLIRAELAPGIPAVQVLVGALYFGWPYLVAVPIAVVAASRAAVGVDAPARLLAFATSGRRGRRDEWGAAMRAELASITASPRERLRFAVGCAPTALRRGWGRSPWIVAAAGAALFAALTVARSRASLDSGAGSLWGVIYGPPQISLFLVGLVAAWTGRSMRTGLEHAGAALAGILLGVLAVAVPEGALWAREAGVFMLDGDPPATSAPLTAAAGALDAVKATTLTWGLPHWLPWPVLGAAAGARLRRRSTSAAGVTAR
jgi:hypothetical protein